MLTGAFICPYSLVLIHPPLSLTDRQKWVGRWKSLHICDGFDTVLWQCSCFSFVFVSVLVSGYSCFMCRVCRTLVDQRVKLCCRRLVVFLADQWWIRTMVKLHRLPQHGRQQAGICHGVPRVCRVSTKSQTTPEISQISAPSTREEDIISLLLEGNLHTLRTLRHTVVYPAPTDLALFIVVMQ